VYQIISEERGEEERERARARERERSFIDNQEVTEGRKVKRPVGEHRLWAHGLQHMMASTILGDGWGFFFALSLAVIVDESFSNSTLPSRACPVFRNLLAERALRHARLLRAGKHFVRVEVDFERDALLLPLAHDGRVVQHVHVDKTVLWVRVGGSMTAAVMLPHLRFTVLSETTGLCGGGERVGVWAV
jgi:hypothetical protein